MLDDKDVKVLLEVFATKEDFRSQEERTENLLRKFQNDIMDGQDKIYGELKNFREEQGGHSVRHDDTEERLRKLEKAISVPHKLHKSKSTG